MKKRIAPAACADVFALAKRAASAPRAPCWLSAAVLVGVAIFGVGCSSSISTTANGVDSGNVDAMIGARPTGDGGNGSACNACATAAETTSGACGSFVTACAGDSACQTLVMCANGCAASDTTCLGDCATAAGATAVNEYQALSDCICGAACGAACAAECGTTATAPVDSGSGTTPGGDRCAPAGCPTLTTMPVDFNSYCPNAPGTTRVCDCPGAGPPAPCTTATQGANLYCCP